MMYGGPDGELGAAMRYLSQRYAMPYAEAKGLLTDIGTEELDHMEMVATVVHQLTRNLTDEDIRNNPTFAPYFTDHTTGIYPTAASGFPFTAAALQSTGDVIADLTEDLAAEQKARVTYDNILRLSDDPDVNNVIRFLREREIVHFQRFGDTNQTDLSRFTRKNRRQESSFLTSFSILQRDCFQCQSILFPLTRIGSQWNGIHLHNGKSARWSSPPVYRLHLSVSAFSHTQCTQSDYRCKTVRCYSSSLTSTPFTNDKVARARAV